MISYLIQLAVFQSAMSFLGLRVFAANAVAIVVGTIVGFLLMHSWVFSVTSSIALAHVGAERTAGVLPRLAAILRRDTPEREQIGFLQPLSLLSELFPWVPGRADQLSADSIGLRAQQEIDQSPKALKVLASGAESLRVPTAISASPAASAPFCTISSVIRVGTVPGAIELISIAIFAPFLGQRFHQSDEPALEAA